MPDISNIRRKSVLLGCTAMAAVLFAGAALADDAAPETIVVTGTRFNTDAAPAKASLDTTEPQTIINRAYIENFQEPQADYVSILAIVPGLTGGDPNGTGLSDGGPKNTLRGLPDGDFVQAYDGIPFGDTNGPTHHNISYFPASTIGSIDVDRGPGNAGNLGAATYGGTIKFFSEGLTDDMHARTVVSYGSFGTALVGFNGQSGDVDAGALGTVRVMTNLQYLHSDGALQGQDLFTNNVLLKVEDEINSHWRITLFGDASFLKENLDDNNGATPAQVAVYGKDFALQSTDAALPTYSPYNYTSKHTDLDYARVDGDLFGIKIQNTDYTYAYWNHTFSPNNQTQTLCDIEDNTSEGNYPGGGAYTQSNGTCSPATGNSNLDLATGKKDTANAILAYSKENAYRVYGDILRLTEDYDFGWVSGELRGGVWWETQATHRFKYYYDSISCTDQGIDPFDVGDSAANSACGIAYKAFEGTYTGAGAVTTIGKAKSIENGDLGFAKDDEHSDWTQYEPFLEWDIHPLDDQDLTITPGVKYVHWDHGVDAPVGQGNLCGVGASSGTYNATTNPTGTNGVCPNAAGQNYQEGFITRKVLPFAEVNYKITPSWSAYFEYAQGIYVPDIGVFEESPPTAPGTYPAPETTTNYQIGTVFYADQFTFDADVYYIPISNNYTTYTNNGCPDTCFQNTGKAVYKGLEGEGTYAFDDLFGFDLHGLSVFMNGALMYSKSNGYWVENAPEWTAAAGIIYQTEHWKFGLIDKHVGRQFSDNTDLKQYEIPVYSQLNLTTGYAYGNAEFDLQVDNLLDSRKVTDITENGYVSGAPTTWQNSVDQYLFQGPRTIMATIKWHM